MILKKFYNKLYCAEENVYLVGKTCGVLTDAAILSSSDGFFKALQSENTQVILNNILYLLIKLERRHGKRLGKYYLKNIKENCGTDFRILSKFDYCSITETEVDGITQEMIVSVLEERRTQLIDAVNGNFKLMQSRDEVLWAFNYLWALEHIRKFEF